MELPVLRAHLLGLNTRACEGESVYPTAVKLDSSLKKNTGFLKKIRTGLNVDQHLGILKDIESLSLEKYLSEIVLSLCDGLAKVSKPDDIMAAMSIVSALHQRFPADLGPRLLAQLVNDMVNPVGRRPDPVTEAERLQWAQEDAARLLRQRNLLRLTTEFSLIGIFNTLSACNKSLLSETVMKKYGKHASKHILVPLLTDMLSYEMGFGATLNIAQMFVKRFYNVIYPNSEFLSFETTNQLIQIVNNYSDFVMNACVQMDKQSSKLTERSRKAAIRTGRILEELTAEIDDVNALFERFKTCAETFSLVLQIDLPPLGGAGLSINESAEPLVEVVKQKSLNVDDLDGVWEDSKEMAFYTKVPLLQDLMDQYTADPETAGKRSSPVKTDGERINEFLENLKNANENNLDLLVLDFNSLNLNNKATKNRVLRFFIENLELTNLRYYARFLKINADNLTELIAELIDNLDRGFRSQIYHDKLSFKNIYFFVELIKFKMIPSHVIFHKIRTLTINVDATNNIDILGVFYERAGRFLLHEPEYSVLMKDMVDLLREKQKNAFLPVSDKLAIRNMIMTVYPPATKMSRDLRPKLTPEQSFVSRLLTVELNPQLAILVTSILKPVDYTLNKDVESILVDCFAHPESINYDNIGLLVYVLHHLSNGRKWLVLETVNSIIEGIIRGIELNDYRLNRCRMAQIKYIAELYNVGTLNFKFINDLMYKILFYGHPNNLPVPNNYDVQLDLPDNYFKVQMCCSLLNNISGVTSGKSSSKANAERKMQHHLDLMRTLLVYFQYYIFCKKQPFPKEIEFVLNDVFEKYEYIQGVERYQSLEEAVATLQQIVQTRKSGRDAGRVEEEEEEEEDEDDDDDELDLRALPAFDQQSINGEDENDDEDEDEEAYDGTWDSEDDAQSSSSAGTSGVEGSDDESEENSEEEDVEVGTAEDAIAAQQERLRLEEARKFERDLDRQYQHMLSESYASNKSAVVRSKLAAPTAILTVLRSELAEIDPARSKGLVSFGLLTKGSDKNNVRRLALPGNNQFSKSVLKEQADRKLHREALLNMIDRMQ